MYKHNSGKERKTDLNKIFESKNLLFMYSEAKNEGF